mmetsp:Transcript_15932/g.23129  ORF Transcript_15932/g.23129 Transcript_15932/m.23129 type:complete len:87 (+) Transcript_15932:51-311(+)
MGKNSAHFQIRLDRPSGVFYAGEVVTGSMTLQANGQTCRSLLISMVGEAKVKWHSRSKKNSSTHEGKKPLLKVSEHYGVISTQQPF